VPCQLLIPNLMSSPYRLHSPALQQPVSAPVVMSQSGSTDSSRKLSDVFNGRNESELVTDWEVGRVCQGLQLVGDYHQREYLSRRGECPRNRDTRGSFWGLFDASQNTSSGQGTLWRATCPHNIPFVTYPTPLVSPVPGPTTSSATSDPTSSLGDYTSQSSRCLSFSKYCFVMRSTYFLFY
jgi:hypothetical protein